MFMNFTRSVHELNHCSDMCLEITLLTHCGLVAENWVNIGSGNGLLPDGTKPLPEPMLIYH